MIGSCKLIIDKYYNRNEVVLALIAALFFVLYGVVPYVVDYLGIFEVNQAYGNLIYSLISAPLPIFCYFLFKKLPSTKSSDILIVSEFFVVLFFLISVFVFYYYPWHDDRESFGASVAALFRGLWLILMVHCYGQSKNKVLIYILLTMILMLVDQSRTAFALALFVLGLSYSVYSLLFFILIVSASAAWRMQETGGILSSILYGLVGEGYNGAKGALQVLSISEYEIDYFMHVLQLILQPAFTPIEILLKKFDFIDLDATYQIAALVNYHMNEEYFPMGGFYILSEFVYYGYIGLILLFAYLFIAYTISKKLFDTSTFPAGSLFFIISIKASPYVFWKYIIYLFLIKYTLLKIQKFFIK